MSEQPGLFDPTGPVLVGRWWGVRLSDGTVHGPFRTEDGAREAQRRARASYGTQGEIVTCQTTEWTPA